MSYIKFIDHRFSDTSQYLLGTTDKIMKEYNHLGYKLTLRQMYYQMIARDLFPEEWRNKKTGTKNNIQNYKRFGVLVNNGRLAGWLNWAHMEDRARETVFPSYWESPSDIVQACADQFRYDKWDEQPFHLEVMAEKDAVAGILEPVCENLQVRFTANRGYASSSLFYEVSRRLIDAIDKGKEPVILYLGDHDPSGMDMTRDIEERIALFTGETVHVDRLGLNMDQIQKWSPPENPAKESDTRFSSYRQQYGDSSWELDAIEPRDLADLVRDAVMARRDEDLWDDACIREDKAKAKLKSIADSMG